MDIIGLKALLNEHSELIEKVRIIGEASQDELTVQAKQEFKLNNNDLLAIVEASNKRIEEIEAIVKGITQIV